MLITLIQTSPACPEGKGREGCSKLRLFHNSCETAESTCLDTAFGEAQERCGWHPRAHSAQLPPGSCAKSLLVHPALGAMTDTGSSLQRASQLVCSYLCGPEHMASLGMPPCCFGTVSLGPCWQPPSHMAPAASSPRAAPRAASHPSPSPVMLLIQPHLLPSPKVSHDSSDRQHAKPSVGP